MKNMTVFQLVLLGLFIFFILGGVIAVVIFGRAGGRGGDQKISVTLWGTLDAAVVSGAIQSVSQSNQNLTITYVQKNPSTFDYDLVEAIATGVGPDLVLLGEDQLVTSLTKLYPIPYETYSARAFRDSFIQEGELFLAPYGVLALPFAVDPLVMYWNRDIFARAGLANPPKDWDELFFLAEKLTARDALGNITQSAVSLGEYANVAHAKEILSALLLQSGNKISTWNQNYSGAEVSLSQGEVAPSSVLSFYTQFSDPRKSVYTWSRSLADSKTSFLSNRLAVYFGFASEIRDLRAKSPNLNFDVTFLPERTGGVSGTLAHIYGVAVLRTTRSLAGAVEAAQLLSSNAAVASYVGASYLPPVRKDVKVSASDPYLPIFYRAALVSHSWLDPNRPASDKIFKDMIESVTAGISNPSEAVTQADRQLRLYSSR